MARIESRRETELIMDLYFLQGKWLVRLKRAFSLAAKLTGLWAVWMPHETWHHHSKDCARDSRPRGDNDVCDCVCWNGNRERVADPGDRFASDRILVSRAVLFPVEIDVLHASLPCPVAAGVVLRKCMKSTSEYENCNEGVNHKRAGAHLSCRSRCVLPDHKLTMFANRGRDSLPPLRSESSG